MAFNGLPYADVI